MKLDERTFRQFHELTARLNATSHILSVTLKLLAEHHPKIVDKISATMEEALRKYLAGDDDEFAYHRAEIFRMETCVILDDEASKDRLEDWMLPKPPN
jgi:hypothetical protein